MKTRLKFMVDPDFLKNECEVIDPMRIKIIDAEKIFALGLLGESGRTLVSDGAPFYFEREQAEWMIQQSIAEQA